MKQQECPGNKVHKLDKEETGEMSQKRDREEGEDVVKDHKVPKLNIGTCDLQDPEYWKYNIPPTWEELKERQDGLVSCDTPPSFEQRKQRHDELQAKLLQKEEK